MLRLPDGMRARIKKIADTNKRSMNAEILGVLERWLEEEDHHEGLADFYSKHPPEAPPEGWQDDPDWEPPSDDHLLHEERRQFAVKIGKEAAHQVMQQLVAAGLVPRPPSKIPDKWQGAKVLAEVEAALEAGDVNAAMAAMANMDPNDPLFTSFRSATSRPRQEKRGAR